MANAQRIELLKKYIAEDPKEPFNHYALAMEYFEDEPDKALSILKSLQEEQPGYLPTYYKLAHLLWELNEIEEARRVFVSGIELAESQSESKTLSELKNAFQNFEFDVN